MKARTRRDQQLPGPQNECNVNGVRFAAMGQALESVRFGVPRPALGPCLAVLDKSFLDGVKSAHLEYYVQQGWIFALPEILMFELLYKSDPRRIADLFKLHGIERNLVVLPGIGEMLRAEAEHLKLATTVLKAKSVEFIVAKGPSGEYFELDPNALASTKERTAETKRKVFLLVSAWRDFVRIPALQDAKPNELPIRIQELREQIRDDIEDIRGFYGNHRDPTKQPAPELLDERWASFRYIQVLLLAGLDYFERYGAKTEPKAEKINNEILDLDYLVPALLVGGLASHDKPLLQRFKFLCPKGMILGLKP